MPRTVREWTLLEEIGRGGMGVVYRATHEILHGDWAVKVIRPELGEDVEVRQRFMSEVMVLRRLHHPNVIEIETPFLEAGQLYLPMEFLSGVSLDAMLKTESGPWGPERAVSVMRQAAEGIGFAHRQNPAVLHRDVKPGNIQVLEGGRVKVLDFGLAQTLGEKSITATGKAVGTPAYMAPEVLDGRKATPRSDVYSLGLILYRLLAGRLPYDMPEEDSSIQAIFIAVIRGLERGLPDVRKFVDRTPDPLADLTMRALSRVPEGRPANGLELAELLAMVDTRAIQPRGHHLPNYSADSTCLGIDLKAVLAKPTSRVLESSDNPDKSLLGLDINSFGIQRPAAQFSSSKHDADRFLPEIDARSVPQIQQVVPQVQQVVPSDIPRESWGIPSFDCLEVLSEIMPSRDSRVTREPDSKNLIGQPEIPAVTSKKISDYSFVSDDEKARQMSASGDEFLYKLNNPTLAIEHYEKALDYNPRLLDVAQSLAAAYIAAARWEKAQPLLDLLASDVGVMSDSDRSSEIHFEMGFCAEKLLDFEKTFREYQISIKINPNNVRTVLGLGRVYQRKELWQLATDSFRKALKIEDGELSVEDRVEIGLALGETNLGLGDLKDAVNELDKVLKLVPSNERALELQIAIAERREDWPDVIRYKQARADERQDLCERFSVLLEVGDIYKEKMGNIYGATAAYKEALGIVPGDKVALMRLFNLYIERGAIEDALYMLETLVIAEDSPEQRARVYVQMAHLYQEKLADHGRAIECLDSALDSDPTHIEAFKAIDKILTYNKDWARLAEAHRRMLERLKGGNQKELEYRLYMDLGEIYRSRLKEMDHAVSAYSKAVQIKPDEKRTHEILAQLFEVSCDQLDKAVESHRQIINLGPIAKDAAPSYKAMRRIFLDMREFDKAFVISSILRAMDIADEEEKKFYEDNMEPGIPWFKGTIDPLRWESHLMARNENVLLGRTLQVLYQGIGQYLGVKEITDLGLRKRPEMDLDQRLILVNIYKAVNKALMPLPHKVYRDENPTGLRLEFLSPPALVVGSDMLTGHDEYDIAFQIGRQLTYLHPMHFLASVKNQTELKIFMTAVLKFCNPKMQLLTGAGGVMDLSRTIDRKMSQQHKNQISKLVEDLLNRYPMSIEEWFKDFFRSMEISGLRGGALVACNVPATLNFLRGEDIVFSGMTQRERIEEVLRFVISEEHFILRRALGVNLESRA